MSLPFRHIRIAAALAVLPAAALAQEAPVALPTITVTGVQETATGPVQGIVATQSATATKTDTPILETPRAVSVVTADEIAMRGGAQTIGEALGYTAGVFSVPIATNRVNWTERIRGFSTYQSAFLDGLADPTGIDRAQPQIEPWGAERVEVLKGPASVMFGQINPGGIVNVVSKRPSFTDAREAQLQLGSFDRYQGAFDLGGVAGAGAVGWRFVGLGQKADGQVDFTEDNRLYLAPSLTWAGEDTSVTFLAHFRRATGQEATQNFPVALIDRLPRSLNGGEPDFDRDDTTQWALGYEFTHRFSPNVELVQNARYFRLDVDYRQLYVDGATWDPTDGPGVVTRSAYYLDETIEQVAVDTRLRFGFATGAATHDLVVGLDVRNQASDNDSDYFYAMGPTIDLLDPVYGQRVGPFDRTGGALERIAHVAGYAQDQVAWGKWRLTFGLRYDEARTRLTIKEDAQWNTRTDDHAVTGNVGLLYLFDNGVAPYASWSESFKPQAGQTWDHVAFEPTRGEQHEVGVKWQPPGWNAMLTAAAFQITQTNLPSDDPDHPFEQLQTGEVRMRGFELEGRAMLGQVTATIAYTYLDSEITRSNTGTEGNEYEDTPRNSASVWLDYAFASGPLRGVTLGGGLRGWSSYYGDDTNTVKNDGQVLLDLAAGLDFGRFRPEWEGLQLNLNVSNATDERIVNCSAWGCDFGEERVASATLSYAW